LSPTNSDGLHAPVLCTPFQASGISTVISCLAKASLPTLPLVRALLCSKVARLRLVVFRKTLSYLNLGKEGQRFGPPCSSFVCYELHCFEPCQPAQAFLIIFTKNVMATKIFCCMNIWTCNISKERTDQL